MHETFQIAKWHGLTRSPFIACFDFICAYGLILCTCGNPFFFPSQRFRFRLLKSLEGDIVEGLDSSFHPSGVGPQLPRAMPSSSLRTCYEVNDFFISLLFN